MERQILVPLDGSTLAEAVIPHALMLARTSGSSIHLVRVVIPNTILQTYNWPVVVPEAVHYTLEIDQKAAQTYLEEIAKQINSQNILVHTTVLIGDPAQTILQFVHEHPSIREIALTTHGRSGIKRWLLGSVAEKLIHATPVPLLVVRSKPVQTLPGATYRTVTVPLDGSSFAEQALGLAQLIADWYGATICLTTVVEPLTEILQTSVDPTSVWQMREQDSMRARMQGYLEDQAQRLRQSGFNVITQLIEGAPADGIVNSADAMGTDLIVMTTHGRSGMQRLWMGSVATRVVRTSNCPVLLIRGLETTEEPLLIRTQKTVVSG